MKGDVSLAMAVLGTLQSWYDQMHLNDPGVLKRTIFVDTFGINATDFGIPPDYQKRLFDGGRTVPDPPAAKKLLSSQPLG